MTSFDRASKQISEIVDTLPFSCMRRKKGDKKIKIKLELISTSSLALACRHAIAKELTIGIDDHGRQPLFFIIGATLGIPREPFDHHQITVPLAQ